jgi:toxin CptA
LLSVLFATAIVAVFLLPLPAWLLASAIIVLSGAFSIHLYRDVLLKTASSCVSIRIEMDQVQMVMRNGTEIAGVISKSSLVTPMMTVLNVRIPGRWLDRSVVIFPDSLEKGHFRELRVLLKWGSKTGY